MAKECYADCDSGDCGGDCGECPEWAHYVETEDDEDDASYCDNCPQQGDCDGDHCQLASNPMG
jgi:hypothetical protein